VRAVPAKHFLGVRSAPHRAYAGCDDALPPSRSSAAWAGAEVSSRTMRRQQPRSSSLLPTPQCREAAYCGQDSYAGKGAALSVAWTAKEDGNKHPRYFCRA